MFVTTANTLDTIPAPLLDRMEVIELSGYTLEEKKEIARRYLIPKQLKANGLTEKDASFTDGAIKKIIEGYTMEAGVRTLERTIGAVCRKIAVTAADAEERVKVSVTEKAAEKYLGAPRFVKNEVEKQPELASDLRRFMNYYLPTTRKLVDAYREIELDSFRTEQNEKTKKEIEDTLDTINQAFEKLLNSFFEERAMDISSDISVLHSMLAQEGLTQGAFEQKTGYKDQT